MELPVSSSLILGLTEEGEPQRLSEVSDDYCSYIGFDPQQHRLVEIHRLGTEENLGLQQTRSLRERLSLAGRLYHPHLALILETGIDTDGHLYYATEFVEGEPLIDYLDRFHLFPRSLGVHLVLQLAEIVGYLADFPRLLATVALDDFSVVLYQGRFLSLRLSHLGFDRDDAPVADAILGAYWIETVGLLLQHLLEETPLPSRYELAATTAENANTQLDGPLSALITRLKSEPGSVAIRELKGLKATLLQAAGLKGAGDTPSPHLSPDFRAVNDPDQNPRSPLRTLFNDSAEFEILTTERWRTRNDEYAVDGGSLFAFPARTNRDPSAVLGDRGERYDLILLPPERLVGGSHLPRLNQQMGHSYLKDHPYLVRTRSVVCDSDFTLIASEGVHGFSLMHLIAQRGHLTPDDASSILEEIHRLMAHLNGADIDLDQIDPWRLVFHFENHPTPERLQTHAEKTPVTSWPPHTAKLRPLNSMESLSDPEAGAWRYLRRRFKGKNLPALVAWMMEGDQFDQWLAEGSADDHPLHATPAIADLLEKAAAYLNPSDPSHRQRFLDLLQSAPAENRPTPDFQPEELTMKKEEPRQKKRFRGRKSLSAS